MRPSPIDPTPSHLIYRPIPITTIPSLQGFYYIGPVDGHDLDNLIPILENLRDSPSTKPVLLHVKVNNLENLLRAPGQASLSPTCLRTYLP